MGGRNMHLAMKGIYDVDVSIPIDEGKELKMDAYTQSLLMVLAYQQHDPDLPDDAPDSEVGYREKDCICFGNDTMLCPRARCGSTKFGEMRKFLFKSGILDPLPDGIYKDVNDPTKKGDYYNVYKLNKARLHELYLTGPHARKNGAKEGGESRNAEGKSRNTDSKRVRNTDTEIREDKEIRKKKDTVVDAIHSFIVTTFGLEDHLVVKTSIERYALGKNPEEVIKTIRKYHDKMERNNYDGKPKDECMGMLFFLLGQLKADTAVAEMSDEELSAKFAAPEREVTPQEAARQDADRAIEDGWEKLVNGLALDKLPPDELDKLKAKYDAMHKSRPGEEKAIVGKVLGDLPGLAGCKDFAEMRAKLTPEKIVEIVEKKIVAHTC